MKSDMIRWGLLGAGDIAHKRVARAIIDAPHSALTAACRRDEAKLREFCRVFGVERAYFKDEDLISDPDIDAVYVATPVDLHLPQTVAAAAHGKHVLVEKPMARTSAECDLMIAACRTQGVKLGVAYYRRFYPIVLRLKEILAAGEIGRPMAIAACTATSLSIPPGAGSAWRVVPEQSGGGSLMDVGSHRINLFLDMFGEVAEVKAFCHTLAGDYQGEDCASLILRFQSGAHGSLQCFFSTLANADEFAIVGTKGRLLANPLNGSKLIVDLGTQERVEEHPPPANLHGPLVEDFVKAILEDRPPRVDGEEGRLTNEVMEWAYQDARA